MGEGLLSALVRSRAAALLWAAALAFALAGCAASIPDGDPSAGSGADAALGGAGALPDSASDPGGSLLRHRNGTVVTGFDTYIVRDITFNSGEGFGSAQGLTGFFNGTLWEFKIRFVKSFEVLGKVDAAEAQSAPSNYFVRDELELRRTFRTRLTKTDGETIEFIVRINEIHGTLETGGPLILTRDELETLRRIEFF